MSTQPPEHPASADQAESRRRHLPTSEATLPGSVVQAETGFDLAETPAEEVDLAASPIREMLRIALPSVITMTSYTIMQWVDALMVSRITPADPVYLAAQGNGGIAIWLLVSVALGLFTVVNTFVSQNLGAGSPKRGTQYAWATLWMSGGFALLMVPYAFVLPAIFRSMGHEGQLLTLETQYAQIMCIGAAFTAAGRGIHHYFYGMHRPGIVMVSVIAGNIVNVVANFLLIFGLFGFPKLGLAGAAIGTSLGTMVEFALPLAVFLGRKYHLELSTRTQWRISLAPVRDIVRIGWPGALMFLNEMLCWSYLMIFLCGAGGKAQARLRELPPEAIERAGEAANAAGWIALRYMHASFMPAVGLSIAVTAMVGKAIGMGRPDIASARAWLGLKIGLVYMGLCAVAFVLFGPELIGIFVPHEMTPEDRAEVIRVGAMIMIAGAVFQVFDACAIIMSAALRGAGDTVWPGIITLILSWVCIVGGGHLLIEMAPQFGAVGPWIAASAYIVLLGIFMVWRFAAGNWRSIELVRPGSDGPGAGGRSLDGGLSGSGLPVAAGGGAGGSVGGPAGGEPAVLERGPGAS